MKKAILFTLLMLAGASLSFAQQRVTGRVTSRDDGKPVAFATVSVKGYTVATTTSDNGEYSINVPEGGTTLTVSFIGMVSQDVSISGRSIIDVVLENDEGEMLTESVVTAMGIRKERKALGYAVQEIKAEEILKNKSANLINSLSGKIAGVNVTQSGGAAGSGSSIIIRGGTSLERDNQPLFVVDGVIYDNSTNIGGSSGFDGAQRINAAYSNRVMDINPEDIESMSVLKGASATALYGSRASNGVILITTKKGEEGRIQVTLSSKLNVSWVNRYPEQQDRFKRGIYQSDGTITPNSSTMTSWGEAAGAGEALYNNIEDYFETSVVWDNNVSISGGSERSNYFFSASRYDQGGIIPGTGYERNAFRFNGEQKYGKYITVGSNVAYSVSDMSTPLTSSGLFNSGGHGAMQTLYLWPRDDNMGVWLNDDGTKRRMFPDQQIASDVDNPYWITNRTHVNSKTNRLTASARVSFKPTDWLSVNYTGAIDRYTTNTSRLIEPDTGVQLLWNRRGMLSENDRTYEYLSSNLTVRADKTFGDFNIAVTAGQQIDDFRSQTNYRMAWDFVADGFYNINNAAHENKNLSQGNSRNRLMGIFGEASFGYKSFAYVTVTGRNDWTSTLPVNNRSYFYPSVSGSFVFSELLPKNNILSFGKLRASWARVGKDASPYVTNTYLSTPEVIMGGRTGYTVNQNSKGNDQLKPENTEATELGLELRFLNGRLSLDYAYYTNNTYNQIVSPRLSQAGGYYMMSVNAGDVKNKGMELSITGTPIKRKDFVWEMMLNISGNRGKVNNLLPGVEILYVTDVQVGNAKAASFNGGDYMGISGDRWARDDNGNLILSWTTGYPTTNSETQGVQVGNREPKFFGGFNNSLTYKSWNLSFLLDFRVGGDVYNGTDYHMTVNGMSKRSMDRESVTLSGVSLNPATNEYEPKTVTLTDRYAVQEYWRTAYAMNTENFITDTNWLRLRAVALSYSLPDALLAKTKVFKRATVTVTGQNLLLWTNYKGMDPETSAAGAGAVGSSGVGIDYCGVPATAGVSFGINLTF